MEKGTTPPSSSPSLPYELLREVVGRCDDHETLVRCAASSKLLCHCILDRDPSAIRRLAGGGGGFAPSLLLGVFHQSPRDDAVATRFAESPSPAVVPRHPIRSLVSRSAADLLTWFYEPAACGGGLLVLRRDRILCVCNPMTGDCGLLPPPEVMASWVAILVGDDRPFQLLAVDLLNEPWGWGEDQRMTVNIRSQLFSSPAGGSSSPAIMPTGAWGPVRRALDDSFGFPEKESPVVINRVAHWLLISGADVLAIDADDGGTELIRGPRELERHLRFIGPDVVLLASTPDRQRLSLVVVEELVISMFVLTSSSSSEHSHSSWERRALVVREGILAPPRRMSLELFSERSGTVVIRMACQPGWLLLNLETKEVMHMLCPDMEQVEEEEQDLLPRWWVARIYEMDLPSLATALLEYPDYYGGASSRLTIKFGQVLATVDIARAVKPCKTFIGTNLLKKQSR